MNQEKNYTEKKKNKKLLIALIVFVCCVLATVGVIAAYFSDMISQSEDMSSGTLKIEGAYTFFVNGTQKSLSEIQNISPGDIIFVKGSISNIGSKSAWIRDKLIFADAESFLPYLEIYLGEFDRAAILAGGLSQSLIALDNGVAVTSNKVIDGTVENASSDVGGSFSFLNSSSYEVSFTIYFVPQATNETQGKIFNFTVGAQALQFCNNNSVEPNETAWATVVSAS